VSVDDVQPKPARRTPGTWHYNEYLPQNSSISVTNFAESHGLSYNSTTILGRRGFLPSQAFLPPIGTGVKKEKELLPPSMKECNFRV